MQTSSQTLTKKARESIMDNLVMVITDLEKKSETAQFVEDFLSETEQIVLGKRLAIAFLLKSGQSYEQIKKDLNVSSATISSVAELIKKPGVQLALKKIEADKWADNVLQKFKIFK